MTWRLDGATAVLTLRMPVDMAVELWTMLAGFVDDDVHTPESVRRVDAMMVMAEMATLCVDDAVGPPRDPRYLANVHLTPDVLDTPSSTETDPSDSTSGSSTSGPPMPSKPSKPSGVPGSSGAGRGVCCVQPGGNTHIAPAGIAPSTARRMLCDAAIQGFRNGNDTGEAEIGTATPTVSRRLRRALRLRDGGCRFPGCTMAAWVDAHHIQHWLDLGPTRPNNLVCLCRKHHRLMHEGRWNITGDPAGELFFHQPDGTIIAGQPPIRRGDASLINQMGLTAEQGRCGWTTARCNFSALADMIHDTERARRRSRTCRPSREPEPASTQSPRGD